MSDLAALLPASLRVFVSPHVGPVTHLEECLADTDEPRLVRVGCELSAGDEVIGTGLGPARNVGGSGFTRAQAACAATGEAVERYSASCVPTERLVLATARELGSRAARPSEFALFARSQYARPDFPFTPFTEGSQIAWVDGVDLATGEVAWLPAELVFLAPLGVDYAHTIGYATSSGLACAESEDEALERALLELLERDAFMLAWWRRCPLPRLDWSGSAWMAAIDATYFVPAGLEYHALDLSAVHDVPTVAGVVLGPEGSCAALGVGAAATPRIEDAWWRGLGEAFASRSACRKLRLLDPDRRYEGDGSDVTGFDDHICFYAEHDRVRHASFLWSSSCIRPAEFVPPLPAQPAARRETLLDRFRRAGSRAYAVNVTAPDVATTGLHVVKAVAPGLCALDAIHALRFLGSPRLVQSETDILTSGVRCLDDLNPHPHPFP
jgi:ribosomal protein S12 methylthiotransferase accessory factor